jgi:tetratricopeptide (TPR) repeat protein
MKTKKCPRLMAQTQWLQSLQATVTDLASRAIMAGLSAIIVSAGVLAQTPPDATANAAPPTLSKADALQAKAIEAMANQSWAVAQDLLLQAQHALHREHGVVTEQQGPILDQLARTHVEQKDYRQANRFKELNHFLGQRSTSIETQAQAEIALARWYLSSGQFDAARRLLSASLKTELARESFEPERALLRLDVELFSAQCCHSDDAIELLGLAKTHNLPPDLIAQFERKVGDLLILDGQASLAADYYVQQHAKTRQTPELISGLRRYNNLEPSNIGEMKLRQELRRRRILAGGYPDEALWSEAPQTFTVALNEDFLPIAEAAQSEFGGYTDHFEPVIGAPFRFNLKQLRKALPTRYRNLARLEALEVEMTVDITAAGKPTNIRFEDRYPRQVRELMKQVFKVARFKPAIHGGLPVETLDLPFVQRFKSPDSQTGAEA